MKNYRDKSLHQLTKGTFALHGCRLVHSRFVRVDREHVDLSGGAMLIFSVLPTRSYVTNRDLGTFSFDSLLRLVADVFSLVGPNPKS